MEFLKTTCFPLLAQYRLFLYALIALASLVAFILYGIDKYKAKHVHWRISEKTLLRSAVFFGGIGAYLGMRVFHHKTKHRYFRVLLPLFAVLQTAFLLLLLYCGLIL